MIKINSSLSVEIPVLRKFKSSGMLYRVGWNIHQSTRSNKPGDMNFHRHCRECPLSGIFASFTPATTHNTLSYDIGEKL